MVHQERQLFILSARFTKLHHACMDLHVRLCYRIIRTRTDLIVLTARLQIVLDAIGEKRTSCLDRV